MKFGNGAYNSMDNGLLRFDHVRIPRNQMLMRFGFECVLINNGKCIDRQFGSQNGGPETQVIDYKTQQNRLFPLLASAYAFRFVGEWLSWLYNDVTDRLQASDFSTLPEAHACTASLKSLTTSATAAAALKGEAPAGIIASGSIELKARNK